MTFRTIGLIAAAVILLIGGGVAVWFIGVDRLMSFVRTEVELVLGRGNTASNIRNRGLLVEHDDWLFVSDQGRVYRMRYNGTERQQLDFTDEDSDPEKFLRPEYLNILGNHIYFGMGTRAGGGGIFRMQLDGSNLTRIGTAVPPTSDILVLDEWIYYLEVFPDGVHVSDYGSLHMRHLYRMSRDGNIRERLVDGFVRSMSISDDGWIYYVSFPSHRVYRVRLDGSENSLISDTSDRKGDIIYDNGLIFFRNALEDLVQFQLGDNSSLVRMRADGTERTFVAENAVVFAVSDNYIYSTNFGDTRYIYRAAIDASYSSLFYEFHCENHWRWFFTMFPVNSKVYVLNYSFFSISKDGSEVINLR